MSLVTVQNNCKGYVRSPKLSVMYFDGVFCNLNILLTVWEGLHKAAAFKCSVAT